MSKPPADRRRAFWLFFLDVSILHCMVCTTRNIKHMWSWILWNANNFFWLWQRDSIFKLFKNARFAIGSASYYRELFLDLYVQGPPLGYPYKFEIEQLHLYSEDQQSPRRHIWELVGLSYYTPACHGVRTPLLLIFLFWLTDRGNVFFSQASDKFARSNYLAQIDGIWQV